ncbi:hypothetical protein L6278_01125 [Candidatus Parcubacteria bacterium]|nr:hypothetical protein [Patescibacteria group bacterium]MCG2686721.1 hypothetical protein [Candidatus Parcubacteria bacterium]
MLEQQDYNQIKQIFNEEGKKLFEVEGKKLEKNIVTQVVNQLGEVIEDNILPAMERIARHKQANKKTNLLTKFLQDKKVLLDEEVEKLNQIEIFANRPEVKPQI